MLVPTLKDETVPRLTISTSGERGVDRRSRFARSCLVGAMVLVLGVRYAAASGNVESVQTVIEDGSVSTMLWVGDVAHLLHSGGGHAVYQRMGEMSVISDSRSGMSGVAHHLHGAMVIVRETGVSLCSIADGVMHCMRQGSDVERPVLLRD